MVNVMNCISLVYFGWLFKMLFSIHMASKIYCIVFHPQTVEQDDIDIVISLCSECDSTDCVAKAPYLY